MKRRDLIKGVLGAGLAAGVVSRVVTAQAQPVSPIVPTLQCWDIPPHGKRIIIDSWNLTRFCVYTPITAEDLEELPVRLARPYRLSVPEAFPGLIMEFTQLSNAWRRSVGWRKDRVRRALEIGAEGDFEFDIIHLKMSERLLPLPVI